MKIFLTYLAVAVFVTCILWCVSNWRAYNIYKKQVIKWLAFTGDEDCYVENVMYDFYCAGRHAYDAANEMRAMHYED